MTARTAVIALLLSIPPVLHAQPGNARTRRMAEMHSWRDETDRRSLLRRVGLPEVDED